MEIKEWEEFILQELEEELAQGCEALVHNLGSLQSRPGSYKMGSLILKGI